MRKMNLISICTVILIALVVLSKPVSAQVELAYDDGTPYIYTMLQEEVPLKSGQFLRQRFYVPDFDFSGDVIVETVKVYWASILGEPTDILTVQIRLRDADDENYVFEFPPVTYAYGRIDKWIEYDVPEAFVSDDFYVELIPLVGKAYIRGDSGSLRPYLAGTNDCNYITDEEYPYDYCAVRESKLPQCPINSKWKPMYIHNEYNYYSHMIRALVRSHLDVEIDIKPGSDPNCFNINGHGVIPVAILGSAEFKVDDIDLISLDFAGLSLRVRGNRGPMCSIEDSNGDPYPDLVCQFEDDSENWSPGNGTAMLTGELLDGSLFEGSDSICVVP
jgi:hypothetical protein